MAMQGHMLARLALLLALGAGRSVSAQMPPAAPGDPVRGLVLYNSKCSACHSVDEDRVGPHHRGVVGRKAGGVRGYEYSDALAASKLVWTRENLVQWLTEPEQLIPGQRMGFRLTQAKDRADVVAYLAGLSTAGEAAGRSKPQPDANPKGAR